MMTMDERKDRLFKLCRKYVDEQRIEVPEQTASDRVFITAPDLIKDICELAGYHAPADN